MAAVLKLEVKIIMYVLHTYLFCLEVRWVEIAKERNLEM